MLRHLVLKREASTFIRRKLFLPVISLCATNRQTHTHFFVLKFTEIQACKVSTNNISIFSGLNLPWTSRLQSPLCNDPLKLDLRSFFAVLSKFDGARVLFCSPSVILMPSTLLVRISMKLRRKIVQRVPRVCCKRKT